MSDSQNTQPHYDPIAEGLLRATKPEDLAELAKMHNAELREAEEHVRAMQERAGGVEEAGTNISDLTILDWAEKAAIRRTETDNAQLPVDPDGRGGLATPDEIAAMERAGQGVHTSQPSAGGGRRAD